MDSVLRAIFVYLLLLVLFRMAGKRTLAHMSTFDLVLLLIISESIQNALLGRDESLTNATLVVVTLVLLDIALSLLKYRSRRAEKLIDGLPLVLVRDGQPEWDHMKRERVDLDDIVAAGRERQGVGRLEDIRHAVLERNGEISVMPTAR
jgi:uncharacterized membrane protein YcaP (DUF421 family)